MGDKKKRKENTFPIVRSGKNPQDKDINEVICQGSCVHHSTVIGFLYNNMRNDEDKMLMKFLSLV